ncbi:BrnA antitoxin family protein [Marinomonas foliarum]|uniref:BrnA antitoxin family protein n=1 Tax=Marinomonas foliarum TaxID=491950 RepID=UPI000DF31BAC|nr:BrnA antitoxin family protein [Marinomonas foliarum]
MSVKKPYAKKLKKQVTIRLDEDTVEYFKALADDKGIPYQSLINLYLRDCAQSHRDLKMEWQLVISRIPKKRVCLIFKFRRPDSNSFLKHDIHLMSV